MDIGHRNSPPSYAPDAIPTDQGWVSKSNGELLIGTKFINPELYLTKSVEVVVVAEEVNLTKKKNSKNVK